MIKQKRKIIRVSILSILACAIIWVIYSNITKDEVGILTKGGIAPSFQLTDLEGKTHQISDYEGKVVMLNFWGTWCEPCVREMPAIERQYQLNKQKGFEVLSINLAESTFAVKSFTKRHDISFPVMIDTTKDVFNTYNIGQLPATFFIDKDGKVREIIQGEVDELTISRITQTLLLENNE